MSDIEIRHSDETMATRVIGETEAGVEFIDAYVPTSHPLAVNDMLVVDAGRIILANETAVDEFLTASAARGLTVERAEGI